MVSYAAVNTCPHTSQATDEEQRSDHKAHLAFAAGPHACPAENIVFVISVAAIERLMGRLPDIALTVPASHAHLSARPHLPGPHRAPLPFHSTDSGFLEGHAG